MGPTMSSELLVCALRCDAAQVKRRTWRMEIGLRWARQEGLRRNREYGAHWACGAVGTITDAHPCALKICTGFDLILWDLVFGLTCETATFATDLEVCYYICKCNPTVYGANICMDNICMDKIFKKKKKNLLFKFICIFKKKLIFFNAFRKFFIVKS